VSRESWHEAQETRLIQPQRVQFMRVQLIIAQLMIAQLTRVQLKRVQLYVVLQTYNKSVSLMQPTNSM
jgi:hypothetical protein